MKYRVGSRVRVRKDLKYSEYYPMEDGIAGDCVTEAMLELCGKVVTISYADEKYKVKEDDGEFWWVDGMFDTLKCLMA